MSNAVTDIQKSVEADHLMVKLVTSLMLARLEEKRPENGECWAGPTCDNKILLSLLRKNVLEGDMIDVLNLAGMILVRHQQLGESTVGNHEGMKNPLDSVLSEMLARRVDTEHFLLECATGKRPLPDAATCRTLALRLGTPKKHWAPAITGGLDVK